MPMRRDPALWHSLSGVVAAYQPVAAPGPLAARYNQANGGSNLHQATDGVAPTWSPLTGWTFNGSSQHLDIGVYPTGTMSVIARFSNGIADTGVRVVVGNVGTPWYGLWQRAGDTQTYYHNGSGFFSINGITAGVMGMSPSQGYLNGNKVQSYTPATFTGDTAMAIGRANPNDWCFGGDIQAVVIYAESLDDAQMAQYSHQMAYCHVNPDWSAWGRRRRYYYAPAVGVASAQARVSRVSFLR